MFTRFIKISLLGIFLFYYSGSVMFYHSHWIDGVRIVHSHPFPLSPSGENHSHSTAELHTIKMMSLGVFLPGVAVFILSPVENLLIAYRISGNSQSYVNQSLLVKSMRAPPRSSSPSQTLARPV